MLDFYRLSKTKPVSNEEIESKFINSDPLCMCDSFRINGRRTFHQIKTITPIEWGELISKYDGMHVFICCPFCQCSFSRVLESNERYSIWERIK